MAEQLRSALDALTPREATIMAMRFGLYDGNPHTLDEIGRALGLTRERIRQLEKQSLSKLRHPSRAQPLLDFASLQPCYLPPDHVPGPTSRRARHSAVRGFSSRDCEPLAAISAARRIESWSAWLSMAAIGEFTRQHAEKGGRHEFAADELADELHLAWQSAAGQMDYACTVADRLPRCFAALPGSCTPWTCGSSRTRPGSCSRRTRPDSWRHAHPLRAALRTAANRLPRPYERFPSDLAVTPDDVLLATARAVGSYAKCAMRY